MLFRTARSLLAPSFLGPRSSDLSSWCPTNYELQAGGLGPGGATPALRAGSCGAGSCYGAWIGGFVERAEKRGLFLN